MAKAGDRYDSITGNIWSYAKRGDLTGTKAALNRGVDVNMQNTVGWTALHAAASSGDIKMIKFLLREGAQIDLRDRGGNLAIHEAAKNGHVNALRQLSEAGANLSEIRLSQTKGAAVRSLVSEAVRKANKRNGSDVGLSEEGEEGEPAVGYNRIQVKSNAMYGPRKTPISCKIKKQILQRKRQGRAAEQEEQQVEGGGSEVTIAGSEESELARSSMCKASDAGHSGSESEGLATEARHSAAAPRGCKRDETAGLPSESFVEAVQTVKRQRNKQRHARQRLREGAEELSSNANAGCSTPAGRSCEEQCQNEDDDDDDDDEEEVVAALSKSFALLASEGEDSSAEDADEGESDDGDEN